MNEAEILKKLLELVAKISEVNLVDGSNNQSHNSQKKVPATSKPSVTIELTMTHLSLQVSCLLHAFESACREKNILNKMLESNQEGDQQNGNDTPHE